MSLDQLHPFAGQHAIESAAFALDFIGELDIAEVLALRNAANQLVGDFPVVAEKQVATLNFQVGAGSASASSPSIEVGGFTMQRPALLLTERPLRLIDISRSGVVVVINDYTRWDKFKADVDRYLTVLLAPIDNQKAVAGIGLQFNDIFLWRADPSDLKLNEVFSANNPYIAPNVLEAPLLWHSHHGYLVSDSEPVQNQQLDNINVSRVVVNEEHRLQILTSHRVTFEKPLESWSTNKTLFFNIQEKLHNKNKAILRALLTPDAQLKINLNGPKEM